ncbi:MULTISPECIES: hypothetical protein [Streptomyces]|uniref:Uncharacterized protein n=1 Tax=Streptomyces katrae TaxID=68223 RepID=A0A0F4JZE4_9ACTN|nr:hypothetical protein [Streptomyces katrae]KJY39083.1 hypothetical protein VR44_02265 [Streptomyces katrae]
MPIDPYAALNAMIRAEAVRFSPAAREGRPAAQAPAPQNHRDTAPEAPGTAADGEPQRPTADPAA